MKIEKRDIPIVALSAFIGFLVVLFALASHNLATAIFVGVIAGAPSGACGGVLVCILRRLMKKQ